LKVSCGDIAGSRSTGKREINLAAVVSILRPASVIRTTFCGENLGKNFLEVGITLRKVVAQLVRLLETALWKWNKTDFTLPCS
jgi:hypothetical protein